jgi:imidazolonepropionase-like amidohydrolase
MDDRALSRASLLRLAGAAATALGLGARTGTVEAGKWADLLVVDGDPFANIALLTAPERHLKLVMNRGRIFKQHLDS